MIDPIRTQASAARAVPAARAGRRFSALRLVGTLLAAVLPAALTSAQGAADRPAQAAATGWIDGFEGAADDFLLTRRDQPVPVYPLLPLYPGDRLEVRAANGRLRLHTSETGTLVIDPAHSPFTMPAAGQAPTPWGNLMDWAGRLFAGLHAAHTQAQLVVTVGRGDPQLAPASGLLFIETVRLAPGRRALALAWRNGKAPYRVRITPGTDGAAPLADLSGLTEPHCVTPEIALSPGAYLLEVRDADDKTLVTGISVVEAGELPQLDPAALPAGLSEAAARTIRAAWLAGQEGGWVWRLEAYQQVAGIGDYAPAEWLRAALVAERGLPTGPAIVVTWSTSDVSSTSALRSASPEPASPASIAPDWQPRSPDWLDTLRIFWARVVASVGSSTPRSEPQGLPAPLSQEPTPAPFALSRFPTMDCQACEDDAHVNQPFSVLFSLTRDRKTPEARIDEQHADADGAARLQLPKDPDLPDQDAWEIQADLTAQGFTLEGPDSRTIRLPRSGDSDLARFRLTPKAIDGDQAQRQIQISLWHRGTFLGQVSRDLTVYADRAPAVPRQPLESGAAPPPPASGASPSAISAAAPQSLLAKAAPGPARPGHQPEPQPTPVLIGIIDKEPPDLTVFLNYPAPGTGGEGTVTIHSRYQQSVTAALPAADGLEDWLRTLSLGVTQGAPRRPVQLSETGPGTDEDPRRTIDRMQSLGEDAWRRFAPEVFQNAYWDLRERLGSRFDSIQIITNQPLVPWELMRPSRKGETDDFLGTAFRIGRWHLNRTAGVLRSPEQQQVLRDLIAIAPDYAGSRGLPAVSEELRGLARFTGYRRLDARYESLRDLGLDPQRPRGIIHFAGHGEAAADAPAAQHRIKLEDGDLDPLAWRALFKPSSAHPLVFLNACEIGQARAVGFFVEGWAPAVLETGASGFVGGLWPLPDDSAAAFAIRFYADLVGRLERNGEASVAEVLRETRTRFRETGDPTYLAYVFYGDPELRFQAAAPAASDARAEP